MGRAVTIMAQACAVFMAAVCCAFFSLCPIAVADEGSGAASGIVAYAGRSVLAAQDSLAAATIPQGTFEVNGVRYEVRYWSADGSYYAVVTGATDSVLSAGRLVIPDAVPNPEKLGETFHVASVGQAAFMKCTSLKEVVFSGSFGGRICGAAFYGCTALRSVTFSDTCTLSRKGPIDTASDSNPIGAAAFGGCRALTFIEIPPITSATSKDKDEFTMSVGHWHGQHTPVAVNGAGISTGVFTGCSSLKSIVFRAGHAEGAYAYFNTASGNFTSCRQLRSIIYESYQPFWMNPDAVHIAESSNGTAWDWETDDDWAEQDYPTFYYAVDYYASKGQAEADLKKATPNCTHSNRLARVEYARGTEMAAISAGTATAYVSAGEYAVAGTGDGRAPDAATAAGFAGQAGWVWKFQEPYGASDKLYESCYAYPVRASDLSAGHASSSALDGMRVQAYEYMEPWFDIDRYSRGAGVAYDNPDTAQGILYRYRNTAYTGSAAHTVLLDGSFEEEFSVTAADGTALTEGVEYTRSFKRYDENSKRYVEMDTPDGVGPYIVCLAGMEGTPYSGTALEIWVRLQRHRVAFDVTQNSGGGAAQLAAAAIGTGGSYANKSAPYAVLVDDANPDMLFMAAGFAGFAGTSITPTTNGEYGKALRVVSATLGSSATKRVLAVGVSREAADEAASSGVKPSVMRYDFTSRITTPSQLAIAAYQDFNTGKADFGVSGEQWGTTAVLCPTGLPADFAAMAAYAYTMRAPVFFLEKDGSVSNATLACLADFDEVALPGGEKLVSAAVAASVEQRAGARVVRIGEDGDGQCGFSIAVADALALAGKASFSRLAIVSGSDPLNVTCGLTLAGPGGGVTFVTNGVGDSKRIVGYLARTGRADGMSRVYLLEPSEDVFSSSSWDVKRQINRLMAGEVPDTALEVGDRFGADGNLLVFDGDGKVILDSRYGGSGSVGYGSVIAYGDGEYVVSSLNLSEAVVGGMKNVTYNGKPQRQNPVVTLYGNKLVSGTDYTLSYSANTKAGTARVVAAGTGHYFGSARGSFTIAKAAQPMKASVSMKTVKRSKLERKAQTVKPITVSKAQGSLSFAKKGGSKQLAINKKSGKVTVKKGTSKGTYTMKVAIKAAGNGNYKAATKNVAVKVRVK